jgi:hypothetical protein
VAGIPNSDSPVDPYINDSNANNCGGAIVFQREGPLTAQGSWTEKQFLLPEMPQIVKGGERCGRSLAISHVGNVIIMGCAGDNKGSVGVDDFAGFAPGHTNSGAAYIFRNFLTANDTYVQDAYLSPFPRTFRDINFGGSVALNYNGSVAAVGGPQNTEQSVGVNPSIFTNTGTNPIGAVYTFTSNGAPQNWQIKDHIKASNARENFATFGVSVALNDDGSVLAVGAIKEDSDSRGLNGDKTTISVPKGAVYVFRDFMGSYQEEVFIKGWIFSNQFFVSSLIFSVF